MDNVLIFPGRVSSLSKAAEGMTLWFKERKVPDAIAELFLKVSCDENRELLPDNVLENVQHGVTQNQDSPTRSLFLDTSFRPTLVPEFGTQGHRRFFQIIWFPSSEELITVPFPDDLMQQLCNYFDTYPEINNANFTAFCYSLLRAVLHDDRYRYVQLDLGEGEENPFSDKFAIGLTEEVEEGAQQHLYIFVVDFLPILLDNAAIKYWEEKLQEN